MENAQINPTLDRLFRHMAWANAYVFDRLAEIPTQSWELTAPHNEWSVAGIAEHLAGAAGFYVIRLNETVQSSRQQLEIPVSKDGMTLLAEYCHRADEELRLLAARPESTTTFFRDGETIRRARSTILAQSIHHATEHRAQIAGILSGHQINAIDLDEIDLWGYGDWQGLGE